MNATANMLRVEQAYDGELITEIALKSPEEVEAMMDRAIVSLLNTQHIGCSIHCVTSGLYECYSQYAAC